MIAKTMLIIPFSLKSQDASAPLDHRSRIPKKRDVKQTST